MSKAQQQQNNINSGSNNLSRRDQHQNAPPPNLGNEQINISPANASNVGYQYTMADVPKLAEQAASMYATNPAEKQSYFEYYKDFYTKQVSQNVSS